MIKVDQLPNLSHETIQPNTTESESTPHQTENQYNLAQNPLILFEDKQPYFVSHSRDNLKLISVYIVSTNLLEGSKITPNIRARIRCFVMDQCSKQWITREACTLACTLIDLYLFKKGFCEIQELQTMAISCLMLARKLQEGKPPTISFNIFTKQALLNWEKRVAKKLQYQLFPTTYIAFAQHIVVKWDSFTSDEHQFTKKIGECQVGFNTVLRKFYQKLDCLFLVTQSFKWDLQSVIMNLLYLVVFGINAPKVIAPDQLSEEQFITSFYTQKSEFKQFFQKFLIFYSKDKNLKLIPELGCYLRFFFALNGSKKEFAALNSNPMFNNLRVWDKLQTYSKQSYELAKHVMEKIKKK